MDEEAKSSVMARSGKWRRPDGGNTSIASAVPWR
jgi:hypothetical protein